MVILEGDEHGFNEALARVLANPNAKHVRELEAVEGREQDFAKVVTDSLSDMRVVSYSMHREAALVCGVAYGIHRSALWMSATHGGEKYPRWLLGAMRRRLRAGERYIGPGVILWQAIPTFYREGIHFVEHLGFRQIRVVKSPITGHDLVVVEKET